MSAFDYSGLELEADNPIRRDKCLATKDPEHEIPTRCHMQHNHVGSHKAADWNMKTFEEWANEDAD